MFLAVQWSLLSSLPFLLRMSLHYLQLSCQRSVREFTIISNLVILTYLYCESHAHGSSHSLCASLTHRSTEYPTNFPTSLYPYVIPACSFVPCAIVKYKSQKTNLAYFLVEIFHLHRTLAPTLSPTLSPYVNFYVLSLSSIIFMNHISYSCLFIITFS